MIFHHFSFWCGKNIYTWCLFLGIRGGWIGISWASERCENSLRWVNLQRRKKWYYMFQSEWRKQNSMKIKEIEWKNFWFSSCLLIYWRTYMKEGKIVWRMFRQDIGNLSCIGLLWRPDDQTMIAVNIRQFLSFKMCFSTRPGKHKYKEFSYNIKSPS